MFNPIFLAFIVFYAILCSIEFIVFNEEVLLALCFFSFIFFCFNLLSDSTAENLNSRANKFEADFLSLFWIDKDVLNSFFNFALKKRGLLTSYNMLLSLFLKLTTSNFSLISDVISTSKKVEADIALKNLKATKSICAVYFQKKIQKHLIYNLIFSFSPSNLTSSIYLPSFRTYLLTFNWNQNFLASKLQKRIALKFLSI